MHVVNESQNQISPEKRNLVGAFNFDNKVNICLLDNYLRVWGIESRGGGVCVVLNFSSVYMLLFINFES